MKKKQSNSSNIFGINYDDVSKNIIDQIVENSFSSYTKKIEIGIEDIINQSVEKFHRKCAQSIFETINFYKSVSEDEGILFPEGTRFFFKKANSTTVVIEQKPCVRNVLFDKHSFEPRSPLLAFPYVVFLARCIKNDVELYCFFRNEPLETLNSVLFHAILPNIGFDGKVCQSNKSWKKRDPVNLKIQKAISGFWQSSFNEDLATRWEDKEYIDNKLEVNSWQQLSIVDPLFVCKIKWENYYSLIHVMNGITSKDNNPIGHEKIASDVSDFLNNLLKSNSLNLANSLKTYLKRDRLEKLYPKDVKKQIKTIIKELFVESEERVDQFLGKIEARQEEIVQDDKSSKKLMRSNFKKIRKILNLSRS